MGERTAYRTCPLCEATCGLAITVDGDRVVRVRGDEDDVFSHGFLCPKGVALAQLHDDPDRLRTPLVEGRPASWDEAFGVIAERLPPILAEHRRDAVAAYVGNPAAHNLGPLLYGRVLLKALGTKNVFSASTVDQFPKQVAAAHMFGSGATVPVPDLDRTDFLLVLGANPLASNGSLMTAPDVRGRLRAIQARGGRIVVVDPRRTRTAELADLHLPIRPATDALLLFALVHVLFAERLAAPAPAELLAGVDEVEALARDFAPERVAAACGVPADAIRRLARDLAGAPTAAVYGRIGTTTTRFGTVTSWLVDVLNALTGNLDRPGGAMFPRPATGSPNTRGEGGRGRGARFGRWTSRVRGAPEVFGELPAACLAEEIETPGEGQVRALITVSGNPARSTPNSARLERALETLEFMVSVDVYRNETTRHADVILPAPSPLERSHYDVALYGFAVRNVANYSPPVLPAHPGLPDEWRTLLRLTGVVAGLGADPDVDALDDMVARELAAREGGDDADALLAAVGARIGPERLLDLLLRTGPYGLTLGDLEAHPHGLDLGPLEPRLPDALRTPGGRVELAPEPIVADVGRLLDELEARRADDALLLVGRRHLRSNNSWMHNLPLLAGGPERCTAQVHPDDAARLGVQDGERVRLSARTGSIELAAEVTDAVAPGVVSVPHGWGHDAPGTRLSVAAERPGSNSNVLADEQVLDPLSGTAALNGIPVEIGPAFPLRSGENVQVSGKTAA